MSPPDPTDRTVSVVMPCFNEAEGLETALGRVIAACETHVPRGFEIILIDDGSTDATWPLIAGAASTDPRLVGVKLSRNHGHQLALIAGLSHVQGDLVLVIDADLQDPPELLGDMVDVLEKTHADVVYGQRLSRAGETGFKTLTAKAFYRTLGALSEVAVPPDTGDFRLMTRRVSDLLLAMPERDRFTRGMVAWLGFKQTALRFNRAPRFAGSTKYTLRKMLRLAADGLMGFSLAPLRAALILAGLCLGFSVITLGYVAWSLVERQTVPGWASVMAFLAIVAAGQFAVLGVIGEYVGRIYMEAKRRPLYILDTVTGTGLRADAARTVAGDA